MTRSIAFLILMSGLAAVPGGSQEPSEDLRDLRVTAAWLAEHLDSPHLIVLHVGFDPGASSSMRSTYADGHIPGSRPVEWGEIVRTRAGLPNGVPPVEDLIAWVRSLGVFEGDRLVL
jgi:3-mercaptopyruvate sulfurtransferase SseA